MGVAPLCRQGVTPAPAGDPRAFALSEYKHAAGSGGGGTCNVGARAGGTVTRVLPARATAARSLEYSASSADTCERRN